MRKRIGISILSLLLATPAFSESYSNYGVITELSVGVGWARVKTEGMLEFEGCIKQTWYALSLSSGEGKEMFAAILAAKASGQRVRFQLTNCFSDYPSITHIYIS